MGKRCLKQVSVLPVTVSSVVEFILVQTLGRLVVATPLKTSAIIEPSKTISEQYQASIVTLKNGVSHFGRIIYKNENELVLAPSAFTLGETQKIQRRMPVRLSAPRSR